MHCVELTDRIDTFIMPPNLEEALAADDFKARRFCCWFFVYQMLFALEALHAVGNMLTRFNVCAVTLRSS